jgi:hypothetical protein
MSSRSANERYRPESGFAECPNIAGGIPPAFRNHLVPTACDTPASIAASSLAKPAATAAKTVVAHCVQPPVVDQVTAMALSRTDPNVAFDCSCNLPHPGVATIV